MIDDFFEGALDGCSAITGIALAVVCALLLVQLLVTPVFWILAGAGLLVWIVARLAAPIATEKTDVLLSNPAPGSVAPSPVYRPASSLPIRVEPGQEERDRAEIQDLLTPVPLVFAAGEPSVFYPPEAGVPCRGHPAARKRHHGTTRNFRAHHPCMVAAPKPGGGTCLLPDSAHRAGQRYASMRFGMAAR